jgi:hypothetical protein
MQTFPIHRLRELFVYDGVELRWAIDVGRGGVIKAGTVAACIHRSDGYLGVKIKKRPFLAHRVIWALVHGAWPEGILDHINCKRDDNRIENLREVSHAGNVENRRRHQSNNKLRLMGVSAHPDGRFRARIRANGKTHHIGLFKTPIDAHIAYIEAKRRLHAHCSM